MREPHDGPRLPVRVPAPSAAPVTPAPPPAAAPAASGTVAESVSRAPAPAGAAAAAQGAGRVLPARASRSELWPRLRAAGFLLAVLAVFVQTQSAYLFAGLVWASLELTLVGYAVGPRTGTVIYALGAAVTNPVALMALHALEVLPYTLPSEQLLAYSFAFAAHICFDRMLGFGGSWPSRPVAPPAS